MKLDNMIDKVSHVTIEKWVNGNKVSYWIVDENGKGIESFPKKHQAITTIRMNGMVRANKTVTVKHYHGSYNTRIKI
jgi:hypothetical protein